MKRLSEFLFTAIPILLSFALGAFAMRLHTKTRGHNENIENLDAITRCWEKVSQCERDREQDHRYFQRQAFMSVVNP